MKYHKVTKRGNDQFEVHDTTPERKPSFVLKAIVPRLGLANRICDFLNNEQSYYDLSEIAENAEEQLRNDGRITIADEIKNILTELTD